MEFDMSKIYKVIDVTDQYGGEPAFAVDQAYVGIVSVWGDLETAEAVAEDLEYAAY